MPIEDIRATVEAVFGYKPEDIHEIIIEYRRVRDMITLHIPDRDERFRLLQHLDNLRTKYEQLYGGIEQ